MIRSIKSHMNPARSRVSKLKKRFFDVLSGSVTLVPRGTTLFLEGLCAQDDPAVCLDAITRGAHGLSSVQSSMQLDLSVQFMNGLGSAVLEYLLRASDIGGDALNNLFFHVVEPPIFWDTLVRAFQHGALHEGAQLVFARVLSRLLTLQDRDTTPYRNVAAHPYIQASLASSSKHEIRETGHLIKHILSTTGSVTVYDLLNGPGGRHDNDPAEFREIAILPTADEILCRQPPFLRTLSISDTPAKVYLDNTFRMLREDMLFDIREEIRPSTSQKEPLGHHVTRNVSMVGVYTGTDDRKTRWGVQLRCDRDFKDPRGSKILGHQSLVCLTSGQEIVSFGTVNRVETLLASNPPVIVIQLDSAVNTRKTLTVLCTAKTLQLTQLDATTFSFEPVLVALQRMDSVPLSQETLFWKPGTPIAALRSSAALLHIANVVASNLSVDLRSLLSLPTSIRLDESQARSLISGLTKSVSLIQGPPGTGKSFIGTIIAKAIHDNTDQTILVVCYTNHALDQFLVDLLKYNVPAKSIVRLGGRSDQSTEHLSLQKQPRGRFRYDFDVIDELRCSAADHEDALKTHFRTLLDMDDQTLMSHLELEHGDIFKVFSVPLETEDGMTLVGQNGKAIEETYLFSRWARGRDAGVLSGDPRIQASARIWGMDHSARQQLLAAWRRQLVTKATESICEAGLEYNELQDAIGREFGESTVAILQQKRIIACTTTGAAIYAEAIKSLGPKSLLVEEAGEILESHVLTALSHNVDQMVLIGDHKQLRPKVNNYELTVESGEGFDLNRSLFERLVFKGYPHETLSMQHRMRPEVSGFVRELTYPELIDAPSTHQRPDIRGVHSNIIFVDHDYPEDDDAFVGDGADEGMTSSKRNTYEAQMVLKIVRYLAQQGYKGEDMVVLTPYLGQLHQLRDALKRDSDKDPILNKLTRAGHGLLLMILSPKPGEAEFIWLRSIIIRGRK
ncbi:P-loop containing nucleoside triphosphate hydrolase protein [Boletus coccyginus]|nr:P-loop containing nucleoside triphosphate hydrolase protein [Boletus coccyginus]